MKRTLIAAGLALAFTATTARAQEIFIVDAYTCANWADVRSDDTYSQGEVRSWIVGMVNGLSLASGNDLWRSGSGLKPEQVFFWTDVYCDDNPLGYVTIGIIRLMKERFGEDWMVKRVTPLGN